MRSVATSPPAPVAKSLRAFREGVRIAACKVTRHGQPVERGQDLNVAIRFRFACVVPMLNAVDTIAALATPVGTSAIAVVRASGPQVVALTRSLFGETPPPRNVRHGDYQSYSGELLDDVLWTFFAGPHSYTGEDSLEVSCHGNPFVAQKILEDLLARGCRQAGPGEFTQRAFLNGRMDLTQAEAVMDIIHARSERALQAANQQLRGSLGRRMESLISQTINCLALIEAYIDFPDEDLPPENRVTLSIQLNELITETRRLVATSHYGEILRHGIKTVIIGEPNAGKSSVLNRLLGRERALVSPEPGTTRDYLEEVIILGAHSLRLIDTAGFNTNPTALERRGMEKSLEQATQADLFLWVIDGTKPVVPLPTTLVSRLNRTNTIAIFNKSDLPPCPRATTNNEYVAVEFSALTGGGLELVVQAITRMAEQFRNEMGDEIVAVNARHTHALTLAIDGLTTAVDKLEKEHASELTASELRGVLAAFGEIAGRIDNEAVLDRLFSTFCIGK